MRNRHWRPLGWALALAVLMLGLVLPQAWAAGPAGPLRDKFRSGNSITIPANETVPHDLYVAGNTVRIDGPIDGDLFVAGSTVDVTGPVTGDLFVAGGTVTISSSVGRHLRVVGGTVTVSGPVQLDLMAGAGTLTIGRDAHIGGDLIFSASTTTMAGTVDGSVLGSAQSYAKAGSVGGSQEVTISQPQQHQASAPSVGRRLLDQVERYLGILLVGALSLWSARKFTQSVAARLRERPLASLGFGALGSVGLLALLIGLFIGMLVLAIPLGLLGFGRLVVALVLGVLLGSAVLSYLFLLVALFLAAVVVGLTLGQLILERINPRLAEMPYVALLLGVIIVVALTAIPVVGGLLDVVVVFLGLGALMLRFQRSRGVPVPAATALPPGGIGQPIPQH